MALRHPTQWCPGPWLRSPFPCGHPWFSHMKIAWKPVAMEHPWMISHGISELPRIPRIPRPQTSSIAMDVRFRCPPLMPRTSAFPWGPRTKGGSVTWGPLNNSAVIWHRNGRFPVSIDAAHASNHRSLDRGLSLACQSTTRVLGRAPFFSRRIFDFLLWVPGSSSHSGFRLTQHPNTTKRS